MFHDLYGDRVEIKLESMTDVGKERKREKEREREREGERESWVAIGKAKGRRINLVMACNQECVKARAT